MRRLSFLFGVGLVLLANAPAHAQCDRTRSTGRSIVATLPDGSEVYQDHGDNLHAGFIGASVSGVGYVQADGSDEAPSGEINGATYDGAVSFRLVGDPESGPHACVNDTNAP